MKRILSLIQDQIFFPEGWFILVVIGASVLIVLGLVELANRLGL